MSNANLPDRPSLEYLKKVAKERLEELRTDNPQTKLADAQRAVARQHGFRSWRELKTEVERRTLDDVTRFFEACASGDLEALRALLDSNPNLVGVANPKAHHGNWTGLHTAAQAGQADAVRLLLEHGADPNAREVGDNTSPLHWAAAGGHLDIVRALLDAGGDVHGIGDVHELDLIGWATVFRPPVDIPAAVIDLLTARGARHHIYSAIAMGDPALIRQVIAEDPRALERRMSRFEKQQTPLHYAMSRNRDDLLDLLIELGADLEATDGSGQTALAVAMLRGNEGAMRRLHAAGAKEPPMTSATNLKNGVAKLAHVVNRLVPMISVPDIPAAIDWYTSIGFTEVGRYADDGIVNWGMVALGRVQIAFNVYGRPATDGLGLWIYVDEIDQLYQLIKGRQLAAARAKLEGEAGEHTGIIFQEDLYEPFYGGRQFSVSDLNGYSLIFYQDGETS